MNWLRKSYKAVLLALLYLLFGAAILTNFQMNQRDREKQVYYEQLFVARGYVITHLADKLGLNQHPTKEWDDLKRWAQLP